MSGNRPVISLDSCVFLAYFREEQDKPLDAIRHLIRSIEDQRVAVVLSAILLVEVLNKTPEEEVRSKFREFVKHSNVVVANVDGRIASLAADVRDERLQAKRNNEPSCNLKIADAIVLSTAVLYKAEELYTFDRKLLAVNKTHVAKSCRIIEPGCLDFLPIFAPPATPAALPRSEAAQRGQDDLGGATPPHVG